jgi:hypothetical protein
MTTYTDDMYPLPQYRVAAIFPEHFQSCTVTLKNYYIEKLFCPKPSQLCAKA